MLAGVEAGRFAGIRLAPCLRDLPHAARWKLRLALALSQDWLCCWCGERMSTNRRSPRFVTFEHVTPLSLGGADHIDNVVAACRHCNNTRG